MYPVFAIVARSTPPTSPNVLLPVMTTSAADTLGTLAESGIAKAGARDAFVARYDSAGDQLWTRQLGSSADDRSYGVAVDATGHSVISGWTLGTVPGSLNANAGSSDAFIARFDNDGRAERVLQLGTHEWDAAYGVAVDRACNVYVTG